MSDDTEVAVWRCSTEVYLEPSETSMTALFLKIVNGKPLTIFSTKLLL